MTTERRSGTSSGATCEPCLGGEAATGDRSAGLSRPEGSVAWVSRWPDQGQDSCWPIPRHGAASYIYAIERADQQADHRVDVSIWCQLTSGDSSSGCRRQGLAAGLHESVSKAPNQLRLPILLGQQRPKQRHRVRPAKIAAEILKQHQRLPARVAAGLGKRHDPHRFDDCRRQLSLVTIPATQARNRRSRHPGDRLDRHARVPQRPDLTLGRIEDRQIQRRITRSTCRLR